MGSRSCCLHWLTVLCLLLVVQHLDPVHAALRSPSSRSSSNSSRVPQACLAASSGVCGSKCQLHLCEALVSFYQQTNNVSDPWDKKNGWELTKQLPCSKLLMPGGATAGPPAYCQWRGITCCQPKDVARGDCSAVNGIKAIDLPINNLNASLANPALIDSLLAIHACGLTVLNLEANNLAGSIPDEYGQLVNLKVFNLAACWVSGTIPDALSNLRNLTYINLSNNWMNGTLPTWLHKLSGLRFINFGTQFGGNEGSELLGLTGQLPQDFGQLRNLQHLNLELNSLTGELPPNLCGESSELLVLNVRVNLLEGSAGNVEKCGKLMQLNLADNGFAGPLPASPAWSQLTTYTAARNKFTGSFPEMLAVHARNLQALDISGNQLTGQLPSVVTLLSSLQILNIAGNSLSGTLSGDLYYLPALAQIDASNNSFVGTIPAAIGLSYSLEGVDLSNNKGLTGQLPPEIGLLSRFRSFKGRNTSMSCAGIIRPYNVTTNASCTDPRVCTTPITIGNASDAGVMCSPEQLLPCFLRFTDYLVPRDDSSDMRCKVIMRREPQGAQEACAATSSAALGDQAGLLPDIWPDQSEQEWHIDPSYYQYQVCECLFGYEERWDANHTTLTCVRTYDTSRNQQQAVILGTVFGVAFLLAGLFAWVVYLRTRPRWLRERQQQAKRLKGAPTATRQGDKAAVSIVVTDVKDFTELTRKYPQLMSKAMGSHNKILRKACHTHAGYVLDQEGDSWCIAFHDAVDAVAFSLQVQQAFSQLKAWGTRPGEQVPPELQQTDNSILGRFWQRTNSGSSVSSAPALHGSSTHSGSAFEKLPAKTDKSSGASSSKQGRQKVDDVAAAAGLVRRSAASFTSGVGSGVAGASSFSSGRSGRQELLALHPSLGLDSNAAAEDAERQQRMHCNTAALVPSGRSTAATAGTRAAAAACTSVRGSQDSSRADQNPTPRLPADDVTEEQLLQQQQQHSIASISHQQHASSGGRKAASGGGHHQHHHHQQQQQQQYTTGDSQPIPSPSPSPCWVASGQLPSHSAPPTGTNLTTASRSSSGLPSLVQDGANTMSTHISTFSNEGSASRPWSASGLAMRFSRTLSRAPPAHMLLHGLQAPLQLVRVVVRIGIATGPLPHGVDVANCAVNDRAKELLSDVANGGQVLLDEATYNVVKDSLAVLGTVNEAGYDDAMLQQLMQAQVVEKMKQQMACAVCIRPSELSFTGSFDFREVSHDNDAMVAHMGAFEVPGFSGLTAEAAAGAAAAAATTTTGSGAAAGAAASPGAAGSAAAAPGLQTSPTAGAPSFSAGKQPRPPDKGTTAAAGPAYSAAAATAGEGGRAAPAHGLQAGFAGKQQKSIAAAEAADADATAGILPANGEGRKGSPRAAQQQHRQKKKHKEEEPLLHVYSIAAPAMRRPPESTQDLAASAAWTAAVNMKRGWRQKQKGFFDAPGARHMDLTPTSLGKTDLQPLPEVTIVFASVADADVLASRCSRAEVQEVCRAIRQCLLQQLELLPGRDGYLCRCRDSDTKYIAAFEQPHVAVQWCLLVQEAMMYVDWSASVLAFPGFGEVLDPATGLLVFRGPRLRMGLAEGRPDRILPDHTGRASYYGHSVNCAARYMDAAAHGGQIVTDLQLACKLFGVWASADGGAEMSTAPCPEASDKLWDAEQQGLQLTENLLRHHEQQLQQQQQVAPPVASGSSSARSAGGVAALPLQQLRPGGSRWAGLASRRLSGAAAAAAIDDDDLHPSDLLVVGRSMSETAARHSSSGGMYGYSHGGWRGGLAGLGLGLPPLPLHEDAPSGPLESEATAEGIGPAAAAAAAGLRRTAGVGALELMPRAHSFTSSPLMPRSRLGAPDAGLMVRPGLPGQAAVGGAAAAAGGIALGAAAGTAAMEAAANGAAGSVASAAAVGGAAADELPPAREAVWALHLGSFSFKGSGTFDMVQIVSDALSGRSFPHDAPRGKGARLVLASGRIEGLPEVQLVVPGALMAAWQSALLRQAAAAGDRAGAGAAGTEVVLLQREQSLQSNAMQREHSLQSAAGHRP